MWLAKQLNQSERVHVNSGNILLHSSNICVSQTNYDEFMHSRRQIPLMDYYQF